MLVVKVVLGRIKGLQTWLCVCTSKVIFPFNLRRLLRIEIDPDESDFIDVDMHAEERVGGLVEAFKFLVLWSFREFAVQAVGPV